MADHIQTALKIFHSIEEHTEAVFTNSIQKQYIDPTHQLKIVPGKKFIINKSNSPTNHYQIRYYRKIIKQNYLF